MKEWTETERDETTLRRHPRESRSLIYDRRVFPLAAAAAAADRGWRPCTADGPVLTRCRRLLQTAALSVSCLPTRQRHLSAQSCRRRRRRYTSGSGAELESCRATPTRRQLRSRDRNSSALPTFACTRTSIGRPAWKSTLRRRGGLPQIIDNARSIGLF